MDLRYESAIFFVFAPVTARWEAHLAVQRQENNLKHMFWKAGAGALEIRRAKTSRELRRDVVQRGY